MLFLHCRKQQFTLKLYEAVEKNREGNTKFCCRLKDSEFDGLQVFWLKLRKSQVFDIAKKLQFTLNFKKPQKKIERIKKNFAIAEITKI